MSSSKDPRNGKWRYRTRVILPGGRVKRISGTPATNTKKASEHAEHLHIERVLNPSTHCHRRTDANTKVPTVGEYNKVFIKAHERKQSPNAIKSRKQHMRANILPAFGDMPLDTILQVDIDMLQADLLESRDGKTVNNILSSLSSTMSYAVKNLVIDKSGLCFWMKTDDVEIDGATPEEIDQLVCVCDEPRYRVAILLGSEAGLRVGEIRALRWQEINQVGGTILISRSYDTSGNLKGPKSMKNRVVPISERLEDALNELECTGKTVLTQLPYLDPISDEWIGLANQAVERGDRGIESRSQLARVVGCSYAAITAILSGRQKGSSLVTGISEALGVPRVKVVLTDQPHMTYSAVRDDIHKIYEAADVEPKMIWHSLRHAYCTALAAAGTDIKTIKELAGHMSIETTLRYIHTSLDAKKAAIANVFGAPRRRQQQSNHRDFGQHMANNRKTTKKSPATI